MAWSRDKIHRGKAKKLFVFSVKLVGYIVWKLSCLFPRSKNKWLFGDVMGFAGNTKYVLIDFLKHNEKYHYHLIWITHNKQLLPQIRQFGIEAYYWLEPKAIWHCLTAGCYIVTSNTKDINCYLSGNAFYYNFWHGIGLKAVGKQSAEYLKVPERKRNNFYYKVLFFYWAHRLPDICLTTSEFMLRNIFMKQFGQPEESFILGMYPRAEFMLRPKEDILNFAEKYCLDSECHFIRRLYRWKKVYIYMPTWRDNGKNIMVEAGLNFDMLHKSLLKNNSVLLLKFHSKTRIKVDEICKYDNIYLIDNNWDIYPILPFTDCLITDYSSIYSEYMLMNKEVIIFEYDKTTMNEDRGLPPYFEEKTPGIRISTFSQLLNLIDSNKDCHLNEKDLQNVLETYWSARNIKIDFYNDIRKHLFGKFD